MHMFIVTGFRNTVYMRILSLLNIVVAIVFLFSEKNSIPSSYFDLANFKVSFVTINLSSVA